MSQTSAIEKRSAAVGPRNVAHRTKDRRDITGGEILTSSPPQRTGIPATPVLAEPALMPRPPLRWVPA